MNLLRSDISDVDGESAQLPVIEPHDIENEDLMIREEQSEAVTSEQGNSIEVEEGDFNIYPEASDEYLSPKRSGTGTPYLRVSPSHELESPEPFPMRLSSMPKKDDETLDASYLRPLPVPVDQWATRTPSPVQSTREAISTPTMKQKKGLTVTGFVKTIADSWKRLGVSNMEESGESDSRAASQKSNV